MPRIECIHVQRSLPIGGMAAAYCGKVVPVTRFLHPADSQEHPTCSNCLWARRREQSAERREAHAATYQRP